MIRASTTTGIMMNHMSKVEKGINKNMIKVDVNNVGVIWRSIENVLKDLRKPVITGVLILLGLSLLCDHGCQYTSASSGGSMGGSDFLSFDSYSSLSDNSYSSSFYDHGDLYLSNRKIKTNSSVRSESTVEPSFEPLLSVAVPIVIMLIMVMLFFSYLDSKHMHTSVVTLQVGLVGTARSLQRDLNSIAKTADTSKRKGFRYILQETIAALLQNPDYCIAAYSSLDVMNSVNESEVRFKELSAEERGKFDELTLINFNIRKQTTASEESNGLPNEYIVVTIIVAAKGVHELPTIKSVAKLKEALQKLSSIPSSKIMAVEVLWTPPKENDILTKQQVSEDCPLLHPL